ncbi:heterokaryon incompatibility protein-domain-containing protein [Alternaria rosae]|uniref:heterokaryon incompatibility protein-domain-containing protein n=1 Tax=Alternaria rosae TaxID=1187941 RepID=UPI001E8D7B22|nr:heterokaryon incompatibility protein-domain-containing protein [Alternaria rosae]KAH6875729.1 heterokaryon incompatibility protein-domain-containing protein [Alternaria rosae]
MTCGYASDPKPLPTRLLQIIGHQKLRLYTPSSNERGRYVCLSHCWGGSVALQTTRATELRFHDNIDWNSLPRTFKDGVDLTWLLGLEYLWIDSLCILQDDLDDWRHEGSKMASVYSNCFITLAATTSANCNGGFYTDPDCNTANTIGKIRHESVEPFALHSQKLLQHRTFGDAKLPLLSRAWAFQERLLSPRVVHFADEELFCECIGKGSCECGVSSSQSWYGLSKSRLTGFLSMEIPHTPTSSQTVGSMAKKWYEIVSYCSTLNLTFHTDTLPALQGIAKQMQFMRSGSYAAGLWEDTIFDDLQSYSQTRNTLKVHVYPSPSWSWASRQRSITFQQHGTHSRGLAQVMSVTITLKGLDLTGEVLAGTLIISARRAKAHIGFTDEKPSKTILKVASRDGTMSASYTTVEWAKNFDITADRAMEVELLELALIDLGGDNATIFLDLRSAEHSTTDDKCPTDNKIPAFERIGIGHFDIQEEAEMYLQSQPSTIRVI